MAGTLGTVAIVMGNRHNAEGIFQDTKGKIKEMAGKLRDNPKLEVNGPCYCWTRRRYEQTKQEIHRFYTYHIRSKEARCQIVKLG
jgi:hypothetical protein